MRNGNVNYNLTLENQFEIPKLFNENWFGITLLLQGNTYYMLGGDSRGIECWELLCRINIETLTDCSISLWFTNKVLDSHSAVQGMVKELKVGSVDVFLKIRSLKCLLLERDVLV